MKRIFCTFLFVLNFVIFSSCAKFKELQNSNINIESDILDTNVFIWSQQSQNYKLLGKTPIKLNSENFDGQDVIQIKLEKLGYIPQIFIADIRQKNDFTISSKLAISTNWNDPNDENVNKIIHELTSDISQINSLLKLNKFENALNKTSDLVLRFPNVPYLRDMKGSILLLMGKRNLAIKEYQNSIKLDSNNKAAQRILKTLQDER